MLDKTEHARQSILDCVRAIFINFASHPDRVRHVAPAGRTRFLKLAQQKRFLGPMGKEHVNGFQVRASHAENMGRAIDQIGGERLAALIADVDAIYLANLDRIKTWRLAAHCVDAGGSDFHVFAIADEPPKESLRDWATADVAGANKKDAFHDFASRLRTRRQGRFEREQGQSNEAFGDRQS